jgi:hypothetical protein
MNWEKPTMEAKINNSDGKKPSAANALVTTENKPPCYLCGSMAHGLRVTRSMDTHGVNFFCPAATREEARDDQLVPYPGKIAEYNQYDESRLTSVFKDMRGSYYGRSVTSSAMDVIEEETRAICRGKLRHTIHPGGG